MARQKRTDIKRIQRRDIAMGICCTLVGTCALMALTAREASSEVFPAGFSPDVASPAASIASTTLTQSAHDTINEWFGIYASSRITELTFPDEKPVAFGPWTAQPDYGATDARDDGSLTEWAENYYITHDWSDYGKQILSMIPGDTVTVNEHTFVVEGAFEYPKKSFLNEVRQVTDETAIILQTCVPNQDRNRIVFGHDV